MMPEIILNVDHGVRNYSFWVNIMADIFENNSYLEILANSIKNLQNIDIDDCLKSRSKLLQILGQGK